MARLLLIAILSGLFFGCANWNETWYVLLANDDYHRGRYQNALQTYWDILSSRVEVPRMRYNIGAVYRALGEAEAAAAVWELVEAGEDAELAFRLAYNRGNLFYESGDYRRAYQSFRRAILLRPTDLDTKHNLELSLQRWQSRQSEPQMSTAGGTATEARNLRDAEVVLDFIKRLEGSQWRTRILRDTPGGYSDW